MRAQVSPCARLSGTVAAPPSKNYTTRFLLAAALATGESLVVNPAANDDALAMRDCLTALGAEIRPVAEGLAIRGFGGRPRPRADLNVGNAGAVLRFLLAVSALGEEITLRTSCADSLGRRPNEDLFGALRAMGAKIETDGGRLPAVVRGGGLRGGRVELSGRVSSQYLSALLFLGPLLPAGLEVQVVDELRSQAAVHTTVEVLGLAGLRVQADWERLRFAVPGGQSYQPGRFVVHGDYPAALAILAAAALLPGEVTVTGLYPDSQGERQAVDVLAAMGAVIGRGPDSIRLSGGRPLRGVTADGGPMIDATLSLATVAGFAAGETTLYNIGNLRHKESDRLGDFAAEMRRAGLDVTAGEESLVIRGRPSGVDGGVVVSAHQDHRLVMALAAVGLRAGRGLVIEGAEHVSKSYPGFLTELGQLGAEIMLAD